MARGSTKQVVQGIEGRANVPRRDEVKIGAETGPRKIRKAKRDSTKRSKPKRGNVKKRSNAKQTEI